MGVIGGGERQEWGGLKPEVGAARMLVVLLDSIACLRGGASSDAGAICEIRPKWKDPLNGRIPKWKDP